jgi:predicted nucleic acid-binding protein
MGLMLAAKRKKLSLVDCVSFEIMRLSGVTTVFTLDKHFKEQGFICLPA